MNNVVPTINGIQQPVILPIFRWRPDRVSGIPVAREILLFALDMPSARFAEKEKPNFRAIIPPKAMSIFGGFPL